MRASAPLLALTLALAPGLAAGTPAPAALAPLRALAGRGARVSALIVRLDDGRRLAALAPGEALIPASVSKLYVAAAALARWGPAHRFTTRLLATGPVSAGVLHGDLVFAGAGDPAFATEQLFVLTRRLAAHGIRRVTGKLVVDASRFGSLRCSARDRCAASAHSANAYNALLSSAAVDFGTVEVAVIPAPAAGTAAHAVLQPFALPQVTLVNRVRTVAADAAWSVQVTRTTRGGRDVLTLSGEAPAGAAPRRYWRAVSDPDRLTGEELRGFLGAAGITVSGGVAVVHAAPVAGTEVAALAGQPLWLEIRRMLTWSNNFMADTLALDLLREAQPPPLSVAAAGRLLSARARGLEAQADLPGLSPKTVHLASGSGLTTASRVTARDLVALLAAMYRRPGLFPAFLGALTVPAFTPVDLLKAPGDGTWMRGVAAKTGSLDQPHSVFALAGYARLAGGGWGAFAVLINGTKRYEVPLDEAIAATRTALTPYLNAALPGAAATKPRERPRPRNRPAHA